MKPVEVAAAAVAVGLILVVAMAFLYDWRVGGATVGIVLALVGLLAIDVDRKEPPTP